MSPAPSRNKRRPANRPTGKPARRPSARHVFGWISLISSAVVTAIAVVLVGALLFVIESNRPGPATAATTIVVPRGASVTTIARILGEDGAVRAPILFRIATMAYADGRGMQAGEYQIEPGQSLRSVVEMIGEGRAVQHAITLPEGITAAAVVDLLARSDVLTGDTPPVPPEGSILAETYNVQRGMDRTLLLNQMMQAQADLMAELWPRRQPNLPFTTPEEALTLASIVERETGVDEERPRVAAVFINRLRRGIRLETDPTIIYGVCVAHPTRCVNGRLVNERTGQPRVIRQSELELRTQYNTYQIPGLPPTPISNPGRASIEAVLNPPRTNEIFFVADGTGGHAFAATLAEHNRNVARWREIERERLAAER